MKYFLRCCILFILISSIDSISYSQFNLFTINNNSSDFTMNGCGNVLDIKAQGWGIICFGYTQVTWRLWKDGSNIDTKTQNFYGLFSGGSNVQFIKPAVSGIYTVTMATWSNSLTFTNINVTVNGAGPTAISKINGSGAWMVTVNSAGPIILDGSGSTCANSYFVSVQLTDSKGVARYNHEAMKWIGGFFDIVRYGPIYYFDVKRFAEDRWFTFVSGQYYRVKLAVGPVWNETVKIIKIQ